MKTETFIVFLDFDGVLVTSFAGQGFDPVCAEILRGMIRRLRENYSEVEIVITSNWRFEMNEDDLIRLLLSEAGLSGMVKKVSVLDKTLNKSAGIRRFLTEGRVHPRNYIILDDEWISGYEERQIRFRGEDGLRGLPEDFLL